MNKLLGDGAIGAEALKQMRDIGGKWAAYQNHAMDSRGLGHLQFLKVGPGCTFETAPARMPDTANAIGWKYLLVGYVNLEKGVIES